MNKIKIIIWESSPMITEGLSKIIGSASDMDIIKKLCGNENMSEVLTINKVDVLILNASLMGYDLSDKLHNIRREFPNLSIIGLHSNYINSNQLKQFDDIIELDDNQRNILEKIRNAFSSEKADENNDNCELSTREKEVLVNIVKGMTNKEIADTLNISIHTVISHRKNITHKTGIKSVSGLTVYALLNNFIEQEDVK